MRFEEALDLLRKGKAVKRKRSKHYIKLEGDIFNIYNDNKDIIFMNWDFSADDILANDWEVYDETTLIERLENILKFNENIFTDYEISTIHQA